VVEVKQHCAVFAFALAHLQHHPGELALAVGGGELHHIAHVVGFMGVAHVAQHLAGQPLLHLRVAFAKGGAGRQLKRGAGALFHVHQAGFNRGREFSGAQAQGSGLAVEGVDDVPGRAAQAVMQGEKGARLNPGKRAGHKSPD